MGAGTSAFAKPRVDGRLAVEKNGEEIVCDCGYHAAYRAR